MTVRMHAACMAACLATVAFALPGSHACTLVLQDHRSGQTLARLPLEGAAPELRIAFEHSVLGSTVIDRYRFTPTPLLVEEVFEGQGYGLPHGAGPGERLERVGDRWRLHTERRVDPLVVRPLPAQRMRFELGGQTWPLAAFSQQAIRFSAEGCGRAWLPSSP